MMALSFLVQIVKFSPENGSKSSKMAIFAILGQKTVRKWMLKYLSEFLFFRGMFNIFQRQLLKVSKTAKIFEVGQLHFAVELPPKVPKHPFLSFFCHYDQNRDFRQ